MAKYLPIVIGVAAVGIAGYLIWNFTHKTGGYAEDQYETHIAFANPGAADRNYPPYQNQMETFNVGANTGPSLMQGVKEGHLPWVGETKDY